MASLDSMSGMEGMGMDMGSNGMFRPLNQMLARIYWYLVVAVFASALLLKSVDAIESWSRSVSYPTRLTATSSPVAAEWGTELICCFQVSAHPVRFPFLTPRDPAVLHLKPMQRHSQSSEKYPTLKWSSSVGRAGRG